MICCGKRTHEEDTTNDELNAEMKGEPIEKAETLEQAEEDHHLEPVRLHINGEWKLKRSDIRERVFSRQAERQPRNHGWRPPVSVYSSLPMRCLTVRRRQYARAAVTI